MSTTDLEEDKPRIGLMVELFHWESGYAFTSTPESSVFWFWSSGLLSHGCRRAATAPDITCAGLNSVLQSLSPSGSCAYSLTWGQSLYIHKQVKVRSYRIRVCPTLMTDTLIRGGKFGHRHTQRENDKGTELPVMGATLQRSISLCPVLLLSLPFPRVWPQACPLLLFAC